ncbi:MAG: hypothetical protein CSYNP_03203 [Syntrophus sp. SKADARSKE-3]|nr:hypothetical protein [Syntrophus sp. SKADARSKE-3]
MRKAFADKFPSIDLHPILNLLTIEAELCDVKDFPNLNTMIAEA